ncbi:hypothetical protein RIF29_07496 [Crotalaria pallida]|uniref:50S ribosomal protein L35 n=1 Tax=Crotalaria pallida TaxID=3830 RepID=A0AAN9PC40_CROPI
MACVTTVTSFKTLPFISSTTRPLSSSSCSSLQFPLSRTTSPKLSWSCSVSASTLLPQKLLSIVAPLTPKLRALTVVSAKGYKIKTHKASAKRFRVTGAGKILRRRAGKQHLLYKKNARRKLRLSKMHAVSKSDYNNVIGALPYLKVNRKGNRSPVCKTVAEARQQEAGQQEAGQQE